MSSFSFKSKFNRSPQISRVCLLLEQEQCRLEFICAVSGCRLLESLELYGHMDWSTVCGLWPSVLVSSCDLWIVSTASLSSPRSWRSDLKKKKKTNLANGTHNRQFLGNNKCTCCFSIGAMVFRSFFFFLFQEGDSLANTALWWNNWVNMLEKCLTAGFVDRKSHKDD